MTRQDMTRKDGRGRGRKDKEEVREDTMQRRPPRDAGDAGERVRRVMRGREGGLEGERG